MSKDKEQHPQKTKPEKSPQGQATPVQHAWKEGRGDIADTVAWMLNYRWRLLVNKMRNTDRMFTPTTNISDEFALLFAMNNDPAPSVIEPIESNRDAVQGLNAEQFIGELSIRFFLKALKEKRPVTLETLARGWKTTLSETLLVYFEAAVIETLHHDALTGEIAADSYLQSVRTVWSYRQPKEQNSNVSAQQNGGDQNLFTRLSDEYCLACFRRCFSEPNPHVDFQTAAETIDNEHFPFSKAASIPRNSGPNIRRFLEEHEYLIAAFRRFEILLNPLCRWFLDLNEAIDGLDSAQASWADELREMIFGEQNDPWILTSRKLIEVIASSQALASPPSQRNVRPVKPEGFHWHVIDLGAREFISSLTARCSPENENSANLKAVWLQRRSEWLWWHALFPSSDTANQLVKDGLRRRNVDVADCDLNFTVGTRIEKVKLTNLSGTVPEPATKGRDRKRQIVIFGGGIAGLTAAHELSERGFGVIVVEKQNAVPASREQAVQVGGIARTQWSGVNAFPNGDIDSEERRNFARDNEEATQIPGEHGYRFFPSFYRHIFDTMKRTPITEKGKDPLAPPHLTAFDQLQGTYEQVFARKNSYVKLSRGRPRSLEGLRKEYMQLVDGLGFDKGDIARFLFKLIRYLMACPERREAEYEDISMLEFFGGEDFYSEEFVSAIRAAPQALVAMDAEYGDARTQLNVYLQLLMDQVLGGEYTDNTLRGPTSDAWFIYWREYLEQSGVEFVQGNLLSLASINSSSLEVIIEWPGSDNLYESVSSDDCEKNSGNPRASDTGSRIATTDYLVMALDAVEAERVTARWSSNGVPADLKRFASYVNRKIPKHSYRYEMSIRCDHHSVDSNVKHEMLVWLLSRIHDISSRGNDGLHAMRAALSAMLEITGEVRETGANSEDLCLAFWMAQKISPRLLRQIESYIGEWLTGSDFHSPKFVGDSPELLEEPQKVSSPRIPSDMYGADPDDRFQTFTGIQYYFEQDFRLVRGHVYFPDTDWGLSVISQRQFWAESTRSIDGVTLRGILSVDIGDARSVSSYTGKSFLNSASKEEVATEVWRQIEDSLRTVRGDAAIVKNLPLPKPRFFHVDENLEFDGTSLTRNLSPFLVNNAGDWETRPKCMPWVPGTVSKINTNSDATDVWQASHGGYRVHNEKVVFCGHYMRTFTRMTTMEAANESARHAVNAILDHVGQFGVSNRTNQNGISHAAISGDYCDIWNLESHELEDFDYFKRIDKMLFERNKPHVADILKFDRIADLLHPEPTDIQALLSAISGTGLKDLGIDSHNLIGMGNSLRKASQSVNKAVSKSVSDTLASGKLLPAEGILQPLNDAIIDGIRRNKP